jgi:hypothetical protein
MAVLQAGACGGEERLKKLRFPKFAEEAQRVAADVLVRVLQVVPDAVTAWRISTRRRPWSRSRDTIPYQDELLLQLPLGVKLGADLVIEIEKLLEGLGLGWHDESDNVHKQLGHRIAVEHYG